MKNCLLSVAIGDIAGSVYESRSRATKVAAAVDLLHPERRFTDDTICTFAVAEALLMGCEIGEHLARRCLQHPHRGYGGGFRRWLESAHRAPYNSFGNGSAMRCAAAAFLADSLEACRKLAEATALPTHNHPEGIKGAVATAEAIFRLLHGADKEEIRQQVLNVYYPNYACLSYAHIQPTYVFDVTCQGTVPAALLSLLDSESYEHCLRLAIALAGDADTLAAIVGPMAYAYYKTMPEELLAAAQEMLPEWMIEVSHRLDERVGTFSGDEAVLAVAAVQDSVAGCRVAPDMIMTLQPNEIFVFGSNLNGRHRGGAARQAFKYFGALWGEGFGHYGQSYAIPTMHGGPAEIQSYVSCFIAYARCHPELRFLVTRIGCGIAGYADADIAPLFREAMEVENILLPASFWEVLQA